MWHWLRPFLFALPAETAHRVTFKVAHLLDKIGMWHRLPPKVAPVHLWGLEFAHPVGLAAGMDKNAELLRLWSHLGFAFVEVGTVTPRPQEGNPRPRLFRIPQDRALLNRMGFNNEGAVCIARRLEKRPPGLIVGINIGKNRDTPLEKAHKDYRAAFEILKEHGDFFVINVSSPNTPGLRELQSKSHLIPIIESVQAHNSEKKPLLLKLSPDLDDTTIQEIGLISQTTGIAGFVAGNTTTQVSYPQMGPGGVSGKPLYLLRKKLVVTLRPFGLPIIGVGGIFSPNEALEVLEEEKCSLIELYTGLVYEGPSLVKNTISAIKEKRTHLRTP
ncbi:MAG: quinone-dependent dihydroorotate dehydrogenase [Bacteroidia bacterium]|nr:quinone-dependent dihydroorotate dehydrogenase [Bacteroidia bacterium]